MPVEAAGERLPPSRSGRDRWRAVPASDLLWAGWGDDYAVFHVASGQTHFVNAAAAALLHSILTLPLRADEAAVRLADAQGVMPGPEFVAEVGALLQYLEALGLVERVV